MSGVANELVRESRIARATGSEVKLLDADHHDCTDYDSAEGGRWVTVCEEHGTFIQHSTWKDARKFLGHPEDWCEACREEADGRIERKEGNGFSEEERKRGLETRRKKAAERKAKSDAAAAAKEAKRDLGEQWSAWTVGQPLIDHLVLPDERTAMEEAREAQRVATGKVASAKRGREQAEENLRMLPAIKSKREQKNRDRLESEAEALDAIVVEETAHAVAARAERDRLARIAYLRACVKAGWKLELNKDGGGMYLIASERRLRIPDDYLAAEDWPRVRVMPKKSEDAEAD